MANTEGCAIGIGDFDPIERIGGCDLSSAADSLAATDSRPAAPCIRTAAGLKCPPPNCPAWDLTDGPEDCLISDYIQEQLNISGTTLKVHKLLGVHEQGLLRDVTGNGNAISSGAMGGSSAANAFDKYISEWRSLRRGDEVTRAAFIGYDFGPVRLSNGRRRYGLDTEIMKDISLIKIMQGCEARNRVKRVRVERSENGEKWYGVAVLTVQDCDGIQTLKFRRSVPSRFWRLRPLEFNGGADDCWIVKVLQFIEYEVTSIDNIQDKILLENRDRDYQEFAVTLRAAYTPREMSTQFDRFGFNPLGDAYTFSVSFARCVRLLGRPLVIGDIIIATSETQYSATLRPIEKYLEVTDVFWSAQGFTPLWKPTVQRIVAKPLIASQESQDITGKLSIDSDATGLFDINDGNDGKIYQDYMDASDSIRAEHKRTVPVKGIDYADVPVISNELREYAKENPHMNVDKLSRRRVITGIDALPPNGLPYTEGDVFPTAPNNGDYHRLTYTNISQNIPARLHRFSSIKNRWIYLETDVKAGIAGHRPLLKEYTSRDSSKTPLTEIDEATRAK